MKFTRRNFIKSSAAAGAVAGMLKIGAPSSRLVAAESPSAGTLREWLQADRETRKRKLQQCLQRIRELEPSIHAWVQVQPEAPVGDGPLYGIPYGAKDIIETRGMATEYGSPLYKGRIGSQDAAIIRDMRAHGAILIGKTVTTAFAYRTPGPTHNPRNLQHTPGGSSSGSAAAVAAGMVPFTIGEQTKGSMIRPASYCGVTGFKPTYDLLPMEGVLPVSKSLDTLGLFTQTPADMIALWNALGHSVSSDEQFSFAASEPIPDCEPEMIHAFRQSLALLRNSGVNIKPVNISDALKKLDDANDVLMFYEGARYHEPRLKEFGDRLDQPLAALIRDGLKISQQRYDEAKQFISDSRARFAEMFKSTPVILTPAATGPAPLGLSTTGDPRMNAPWTALGTPAITIPMPMAGGLPLGLQLTADLGQDARALRAAARLQELFTAGPKISPA